MPMDRPYLLPSQREVLAVMAGPGLVRVADLPDRLGRGAEDIRPAVAGLALCGLVLVEEQGGSAWLVLSANGQRAAAGLADERHGRRTR
jgi:hypothetical protein